MYQIRIWCLYFLPHSAIHSVRMDAASAGSHPWAGCWGCKESEARCPLAQSPSCHPLLHSSLTSTRWVPMVYLALCLRGSKLMDPGQVLSNSVLKNTKHWSKCQGHPLLNGMEWLTHPSRTKLENPMEVFLTSLGGPCSHCFYHIIDWHSVWMSAPSIIWIY